MNSKEIRAIAGISRAEFSRRYGIPIRTLEAWDAEINHPSEWLMNLLERVVREDFTNDLPTEKVKNVQK